MTGESSQAVRIVATLPVCLHLDTRAFHMPYRDNKDITITTENVFSNQPTYLGTAQNMEVDSDTYSHYRFTRITVTIPELGTPTAEPKSILENHKKTFFRAVNHFIDSARSALNRPGLRNYYDYSDFIDPVQAESTGVGTGRMILSISFPEGGLTTAKPLRSPEEHNKVQEIFEAATELPDRFMLDARREHQYQNFTYALLNAVIALEIAVSDTIRTIGESKGISTAELNRFMKDVGLTGNIKATIRLLCPPEIQLPDDQVFAACKSAITLRNNVMHRGFREVSEQDASVGIRNIADMVAFCERLEASVAGK